MSRDPQLKTLADFQGKEVLMPFRADMPDIVFQPLAAKAGMDNFSVSVALDEALKPNGAKICSLAPGVIDTDMQRQLRSASSQAFPDVQRFAQLHSTGALTSADEAGARVLAWLERADFGNPVLADVRNP